MKIFKKSAAIVAALVMFFMMLPSAAFAGEEAKVHVVVENTTYSEAEGAPWEGTLADEWVELSSDSTMMSCIFAALDDVGATHSGDDYLYEINGLYAGSIDGWDGWMGTLNDWFTAEGFSAYTVQAGTLEAGDEIKVSFSKDMGEDIGGSFFNNDKTIKSISFSAGKLDKDFSSDEHDYTLSVPNEVGSVVVSPTASNKNFQVRISVNGKEYKRTQAVPAEDGAVITVTCGDPSWPSMNGGSYGEADSLPGQTYTFTVKKEAPKASALKSLIIHTGTSPTNSSVLLKNSTDSYTSGEIFSTDTLSYVLPAQTDAQTQLRFRAAAQEQGAKVMLEYDGGSKDITWTSGTSKYATFLKAGKNDFTITVEPPAGSDSAKTEYSFSINCLPTLTGISVKSGEASLYLDKAFSTDVKDYTLTVPKTARELTLEATPKNADYSVSYNGGAEKKINIENAAKIEVAVSSAGITNKYTLNIKRVENLGLSINVDPEDAIVNVYDQNGAPLKRNTQGVYEGMFSAFDYTYTAVKAGYISESGAVPKEGGLLEINLKKAPASDLEDVGADWKNFRNSDDNMAITNVELPFDESGISLKWNQKLGSGWSAAPSIQIIADNALIVMSGTTLYKLDLQTGDILATGTMSASPNFGYTPMIYAEGMIICPLANGTLQAFDAKTLKSLWIYNDSLKGQSLSPIAYSDGYIYTGFWNGETKDASFVSISITDEDPSKTDEKKVAAWKKTVAGGFYWAGAAIVGNSVVVGTDDGESGSTGTSYIYSFDKLTGRQISRLALKGAGDQRSSIAYDRANGRIYFTTKGGWLFRANVDGKTGKLSDLKGVNHKAQSTSTPVVYKGRVYFCTGSGISSTGSSGNIVAADSDTLEMIYAVGLKGYPQCSLLLTTAYEEENGYIYLYSTYNNKPGGISMLKVKPNAKNAGEAQLIELYDAAGFEEYCITSLICGRDGTIYYKNDSSNVFAIGVPVVSNVERLISKIGAVTVNSQAKIKTAADAYKALSDEDKAKVKNYDILAAAQKTLKEINDKIDDVEKLIKNIGKVDISASCEKRISSARDAYEALTDDEKEFVENYSLLAAAEKKLSLLKAQEEKIRAREKAAKAVEDLIDAIGENITKDSEDEIAAARKAYDALTNAEKALVKNYSLLTEAERKIKALDAEGETKTLGEGEVEVTINGVRYTVFADAAELMKEIEALAHKNTPSDDDVVKAYKKYSAMTDKLKKQIYNIDDLLALTLKIGEKNHRDEQTGVRIVSDEWYLKLEVQKIDEGDILEAVVGSVGSNDVLSCYKMRIVNILTGEEAVHYAVRAEMPYIGEEDYEEMSIAFLKEDGSISYLPCEEEEGSLFFDLEASGVFAVIANMGEAKEVLPQENALSEEGVIEKDIHAFEEGTKGESPLLWLWIAIGSAAFAGLAVIIILIIKRKKEGK